MRKILAVISMSLLLTGCEERVAEFAKRADDLLNEYQKRIDAQITSSTTYYQIAAILSAGSADRVRIESLQAERNERSTQLEADYREKRRPPSLYRNDLRSYAEMDFAQLQARLTADADTSAPYLSQLVALESDKATIDAYDKILKTLAQPRNISAAVSDIQQFVADSKMEFSKLVCDGIAKKLSATPAPAVSEAATLRALQTTQKCPVN
jgi:hypothetical protein